MTRASRCAIPAVPCPDAAERPSPAATGTGAVSGEGAGPSSSTGASTTRSSDSGPCPTERFAAAPARRPHGAAAAAGPSPRSSRWTGSGNCVRPIARLSCAPRSERAPACSTGARAPADCGATVKKTAPPNRRSTPPASEESRRAPALWRTAQTLVVYRVRPALWRRQPLRGLRAQVPGALRTRARAGAVPARLHGRRRRPRRNPSFQSWEDAVLFLSFEGLALEDVELLADRSPMATLTAAPWE